MATINVIDSTRNSDINPGSSNDTVTITNSTVNGRVTLGGGNDRLTVSGTSTLTGANAAGNVVALGSGRDSADILDNTSLTGGVTLGTGSDTLYMNTTGTIGVNDAGQSIDGGGDNSADTMTIDNGDLAGTIFGGGGDDIIDINAANVGGDIDGGTGNDTISFDSGTISGDILGGDGIDSITFSGGTIAGAIDGGTGDDLVNILGGDFSGTVARGGEGNDQFTISNFTGDLVIDGSENVDGLDVDTLDLSAFSASDISVSVDPSNPENGTVTFSDGRTITYSNIETVLSASPVCFTKGTKLLTKNGEVAVEDLKIGDLVLTKDRGFQPIRFIFNREFRPSPSSRPIHFEKSAIGNAEAFSVSPKHAIFTGSVPHEMLPAKYRYMRNCIIHACELVNGTSIRQSTEDVPTSYYHIMFSRHELVNCYGIWSESWHPLAKNLSRDKATRDELLSIFPEIALMDPETSPAVRWPVKVHAKLFPVHVIGH